MKGLSMYRIRLFASAIVLASSFASTALPTYADATDYRFELVNGSQGAGQKGVVDVRLVHSSDGKPVPDAVVFESKADMGPGMETMTAPVKAVMAQNGVYSFEIEPSTPGTWVLHLAAKVQGEPETVRGTLQVDLVK